MLKLIALLPTLIIGGFALYKAYKTSEGAFGKSGSPKELQAMSDRLQLTFTEQNFNTHKGGWVYGTYQGVNVNIQDEAQQAGDAIVISTLYEVLLDEANTIDGLEILPENTMARLSKVFGAEDIQTGYDDFDRAFIIRARSRQDALDLFACPEVRRNFLNLRKLCADFRFQNGILTLEYTSPIFKNQGLIPERLQALADCAHAIINQNKKTRLLAYQPQEPAQLENTSSHW